ncbi:MAG: terminase large subunit [Planctomycetes bacterium]|nr:terminase large subunit [Planctomycetota bacterium]
MWPAATVEQGRLALEHVFGCERRLADAPCPDCASALEFVTRIVPRYDPWATAGGSTFDYLAARRVIGFFHDHLAFIEGDVAGRPFDVEPWQGAVVANVFGWKRPNGIRRYREFLLYVAAKNGKSPLLAAIAIWLLLCDGEPGAQVYSAAAEKEQAAIIYRHASAMTLANAELAAQVRVYRAVKSMQVLATNSFFRVLTSDADTKHGLNAHGVLVDELHAHKDRRLFDVLKTRTSSRRQPVIGVITTADYERPSICNEVYRYACQVRDGVVDAPSFLPVIYEADAGDDIESPATWRKANPNLGVSVREDTLREESRRARNSPGYRDEFLRTNLNVRTNAKVSAIDVSRWLACAPEKVEGHRGMGFRELREALRGARCFGGLDLASTSDLASLALWFPEVRAALWFNWCPRDSAQERERRDRVPYTAWARAGALGLTGAGPDERATDYSAIRRDIVRLCSEYDVQEIGFDRFGANETVTALRDVHGIRVIDFGQGFVSMNPPSKRLDVLVNGTTALAHGRDPVATWAASNLVWAVDDAGNWKPSKRKSTERIDPMTALIMAIGVEMLQVTYQVPWVATVSAEPPAAGAPAAPPRGETAPGAERGEVGDDELGSEPGDSGAAPDVEADAPLSDDDARLRAWLFDDE